MQKILELHLFSPIENPFIKTQFGDLESEIGIDFVKLGKELERVTQKKVELLSEVSSIKKEYEQFLKDADKVLGENVTVAEAPLMFATSKNIFVVRGWAPEDKIGELKKELNSIAKDKIYVHTEKPDKHDNVPIAFQNPKLVEPFEFFMNLYTLPSYKEIDPTFFLALTFPIFFGMMLGDVGYGLITLALFWYLKVKMPKAKVLNAFMIASVSTIIFGVIFGEYFGLEVFPSSMNGIGRVVCDGYHLCERTIEDGKVIYEIPHLLTRHKQIGDLLSISLLIGVFHLALGLIIGFINVYEAHGFKMAIFEKGGWIMILPFMVWLLTDQLNIITGFSADLIRPFFPAPAIIIGIFVLGGIFVVIGEGVRGAIEVLFMSMLSNILSYGRLMAVGLASVGLAAVVNQLAGQMFQGGILGIIMGVLVLVMGHTINILLGILSPFLHAIRLHYVEFFGKFYHGGGVQFKSFGRKD
jgi:V/A-type H+-transporting ATPase subunit I